MARKRVVNTRLVWCSESHCGKPIPVGTGFYLGKRGKNRVDWYLCKECDDIRKRMLAAKKEFKKNELLKQQIKEEKMELKPLSLFNIVPQKKNKKNVFHCGCTGVLPE
jgi:hypothetical protein